MAAGALQYIPVKGRIISWKSTDFFEVNTFKLGLLKIALHPLSMWLEGSWNSRPQWKLILIFAIEFQSILPLKQRTSTVFAEIWEIR